MSNKPKISSDIQIRNFDTVKKILLDKNFRLNEKYDFPVLIQKSNEIIISDVFPIVFEHNTDYQNFQVYIDMPYVKVNYGEKYGIYLYQNTDFQVFDYNEKLDKLTVVNEDHNVIYTIFLKRFI